MFSFLYCRISKGWPSENKDKWVSKLGSTLSIENRKWQGSTERLYPTYYKWYITIKDLGRFPSVVSAEKTIYRHSFFSKRHINNGEGAGEEFYEFDNYDDPSKKMCEILVQYDVIFKVTIGDTFTVKPPCIVDEVLPDAEPLPPITKQETKEIQLREYQQTIVEKMRKARIGIIVLATGLGKTVTFCSYIKRRTRGRYIIVVPTKNLVNQTLNVCGKIIGNDFKYYKYEKGIRIPDNTNNLVIVGTYQNSHNLCKIKNIDCIIFDECHNTVILNPPKNELEELTLSRFQLLLKYPCAKKFFFTATEKNLISDDNYISMDNESIYGEILYKYDLDKAIEDGYLSDYIFHLVATDNKKLTTKEYVKRGYKSVVFCSRQDTVEEVYKYLKENLSKNIHIFKLGKHDDTDTNTKLFSEYKGQSVIVACKKINVGYDEPQIDTVIHYDISTSSIMTIQRNGRALRINDDKVMATLVFLCDVSGDENSRREEIQRLQRPVAYLKSIDSRLEKRIEKELTKGEKDFKIVDIKVEGNFTDEKKEIYDRCWKMLNKRLTYGEVKEIIRRKNIPPCCKCDYKQICEEDPRIPVDPEEMFGHHFLGWVDFLEIDTTRYYTIEECKKKILEYKNHISRYIKPTKKCEKLRDIDQRFPHVDMWVHIYKLEKIDDIFICQYNDESVPKWLSKKNFSQK